MPTCSSAKNRTVLAFRVNQGMSASFSLLFSEPPGSGPLKDQEALSASLSLSYFLIVDSGPAGSGPLKDQQVAPEQGLWYTWLRTE